MEGLEDAWPRLHYFLHTHGHSVFYFRSKVAFNLLISFLLLNILSVTQNAIKEEPNMHILYFGCLVTDLLAVL